MVSVLNLNYLNAIASPQVFTDGKEIDPTVCFTHQTAEGHYVPGLGFTMPTGAFSMEGTLQVANWTTQNCNFLKALVYSGTTLVDTVDLEDTTTWCYTGGKPAVLKFSFTVASPTNSSNPLYVKFIITDNAGYFTTPRVYWFDYLDLAIEYISGSGSIGNIVTADLIGNVTAPGNVVAAFFVGNGAGITGITAVANISFPPTLAIDILGNLSGTYVNATANIRTTGNVLASYFVGNGALLSGLAVSNSSLPNTIAADIIGNVNATFLNATANIRTLGNVLATYFVGNGALLTGIVATSNVALPTIISADIIGNVSASGNIQTSGVVTVGNLLSMGSRVQKNLIALYGNVDPSDYSFHSGFGVEDGGTVRYNAIGANICHKFYHAVDYLQYDDHIVSIGIDRQGVRRDGQVRVACTTRDTGGLYPEAVLVNEAGKLTIGGTDLNAHDGPITVRTLEADLSTGVVTFPNGLNGVIGNINFRREIFCSQLTAGGQISTPGFFVGNGSQLTGLLVSNSYLPRTIAAELVGNVTAAGEILAVGNIATDSAMDLYPTTARMTGLGKWRVYSKIASGVLTTFNIENQDDNNIFAGTGTYLATATGSWSFYSDRSLKKNIKTLGPVLDSVCLLDPVQYNWKTGSDTDVPMYGFIAQDVAQVFPNFVQTSTVDGHGDLLGLSYDRFAVVAIKAIQELAATVKDLTARLSAIDGL